MVRFHWRSPALKAFALAASVFLLNGEAKADTLSWSLSYSQMYTCVWGTGCVGAQTIGSDTDYGYAHNATSAFSDPAYGSGYSSAAPGSGGLFPLPELKALVDPTYVVGTPDTYGYVYTSTQGVQGFTWTGPAGIDIPIDAFIAQADYASSGNGGGGFSAALAIVDASVETYDVGFQWYDYSLKPQMYGQFAADCSTPGAIGLANPAGMVVSGAGSGTIPLTASSCLPAATFHLDPGDTFYLWARMTTLYAGDGKIDATNSLNVMFNPLLAPELRSIMETQLTPVEALNIPTAVPEPTTWAMLTTGFGLLGAALRRRRAPVRARA